MDRDVNAYAQVYTHHAFEDSMCKYRRKKVLEILEKYQPKKILEVGCGFIGPIINSYKNFEKAIIVEPAKEYYENAKQTCKHDNVYIYNELLENCIDNLCREHFDFILISGLLHEVTNPQIFLSEAVKLMKKNTIIHINVPNAESLHLLWAVESGLLTKIGQMTETSKLLQQHSSFTLSSLGKMVDEAGLSTIEKGSYFIKPFNHAKMKQCIDNKIIDDTLLDGLYSLVKYFPENGAEIYVNCRIK